MKMDMNQLDLFAGIGGFSLAGHVIGWTTKGLVEKDKRRQADLMSNFPGVPIFGDIKTFDGKKFIDEHGPIDIISGGFPCQPFSTAGKRLGASDDRFLWPEMLRIIKEVQPPWLCCENVTGIASMGIPVRNPQVVSRKISRLQEEDFYEAVFTLEERMLLDSICEDLENEGYEVQPFVIPAAGVGAPHKRDRIWIIAYNIEFWRRKESQRGNPPVDREILENQGGEKGTIRREAHYSEYGPASHLEEQRRGHTTNRSEAGRHFPKSGNGSLQGSLVDTNQVNGHNKRYGAGHVSFEQAAQIRGFQSRLVGVPNKPRLEGQKPAVHRPGKWKTPAANLEAGAHSFGRGWEEGERGGKWTHNELRQMYRGQWGFHWHEVATRFCRVDDGIPAWMDSSPTSRLEGLGNAVVWQIPLEIFISIDTVNKSLKSEIDQL